jgi:transcription antitermination factor NusG
MKITRGQLRQIVKEAVKANGVVHPSMTTRDFLRGLQIGGSTSLSLEVGDRVSVTRGRYRGERGTIVEVYEEIDEYLVDLDDGPEMTFEGGSLEFIGSV